MKHVTRLALATLLLLATPTIAEACQLTMAATTITSNQSGGSLQSRQLIGTSTRHLTVRVKLSFSGDVVRDSSASGPGPYFNFSGDTVQIQSWWHGRVGLLQYIVTDNRKCVVATTASVLIV